MLQAPDLFRITLLSYMDAIKFVTHRRKEALINPKVNALTFNSQVQFLVSRHLYFDYG